MKLCVYVDILLDEGSCQKSRRRSHAVCLPFSAARPLRVRTTTAGPFPPPASGPPGPAPPLNVAAAIRARARAAPARPPAPSPPPPQVAGRNDRLPPAGRWHLSEIC